MKMSRIARFRRLPAEIEAILFDGSAESAGDVIVWIDHNSAGANHNGSASYFCEPGMCKLGTAGHYIKLCVGDDIMEVVEGDYVAQGLDGKFYRIPGATFPELYEPVPMCEHTTYVGALEPRERCENEAVLGEALCEDHLADNSETLDSARKESKL